MSDTYSTLAQPPYGDDSTYSPTGARESDSSHGNTADAVKDQAAHVAGGAADAAKDVAGSAKEQAANVASEAKSQARDLLDQTRSELRDQAGAQQQRVASGLHSISDELGSMASNAENPGLATNLVQQASDRAQGVAAWLEERDPGSLLDEVRSFARNRPGTFIAIAAVAGVLAGRIARSAGSSSDAPASGAASSTGQTQPRTPAHAQEVVDSSYATESTYLTEPTETTGSETFGLGAAQQVAPAQSDIGAYPTDADFGAEVANPDYVDSEAVEVTYTEPVAYTEDATRYEEPRP